jgi:hypothetical protein
MEPTKRMSLDEEVLFLDMLKPEQRKSYLNEVEKVRGKEVEKQLRERLVGLWRSFR